MDMKTIAGLLLFFLLSPMSACPLSASSADEFQIVRISPRDRAAVIKFSDDTLSVIREGMRVEGVGKITEITENRVVIDASGDRRSDILIFRWEDNRQRTERIRKAVDRQSLFYAPEAARGP